MTLRANADNLINVECDGHDCENNIELAALAPSGLNEYLNTVIEEECGWLVVLSAGNYHPKHYCPDCQEDVLI